jgi:hypothetical protein
MAQIIKHRRGSISGVKDVTARLGEILVATGSIGSMNGPWVFVGSDEIAGGYKSLSKVYEGATAPAVTAGSYGTTLDGTPFYASSDEALFILSSTGNRKIDLTGNIEGNTISAVTIDNITGDKASFATHVSASALQVDNNAAIKGKLVVNGDISGNNLTLEGGANISGNVVIGGNITIGDQTTDSVFFGAEISSSINPDVHDAFDLGTATQAWKDLHIAGTAHIANLSVDQSSVENMAVSGNLTVGGNTTLGTVATDKVTVNGSITATQSMTASFFTGAFVGDGSALTGLVTTLNLVGSDGVATTSGSVELKTETLTFEGDGTKGLNISINDTSNTISYTLDQNIKTTAAPTFSQMTLSNAGTSADAAVRADRSITVNGTENQIVVTGGTQNLQGDRTWGIALPSAVDLGTTSEIKATSGSFTRTATTDLASTNATITNLTNTTATITNATVTSGSIAHLNAGDVFISGNLEILGSATKVIISSSVVELDDNIITLNAYAPFERYAGFEVIDSGSAGTSASLVWDSLNDYWMFVSSSGQSSKLIGTTAGTYGTETSLTTFSIPVATGTTTIGDSLLSENGTTLSYNTNKFQVTASNGAMLVAGNVTLSAAGGADTLTKTSEIVFRNSNNILGYVSTTETQDVMDGILGYKNNGGGLVFSTVIDGGSF